MELHSSVIVSFKIRGLQSLFVLVLSLANAFMASASSQGIDFSFQTFDRNSIQIQHDASVSSDFIQLTMVNQDQHLYGSIGWATYHEPMRLWDKATGNSNFSNGLAFFLVPAGSQLPPHSGGGALALVDPGRDSSNSSTNFVAEEFDTFYNNDITVVDPKCSQVAHVGIDLNNLNSTAYSCVDWLKDKIMSGGQINVTIMYDYGMQNLSVLMIDADAMGTDINYSTISDIVDTTKYLPEWVTLGFSAATAFVCFRHRSKRKRTYMGGEGNDPAIEEEFEQVSRPKKFFYKDLVAATDNFAIEQLLGEGGFGRVYKGYLTNANAYVAIKKINPESSQGMKEFAIEVKIISWIWHKNLVELIGWCHEKKELLLIYELMCNGSLDSYLFKEQAFLPWELRYKIAQGIASALLYLHEECKQCIVHRDIKSSNIMLDSDFNAKLGDFGLARLVDHAEELQTTVLAGTRGYLALEYVYNGKASKESDVYSFGIVLLEIACGRKVLEPTGEQCQVRLVDSVWQLYGTGRLLDAADSKLGTDFNENQLECLMVVGPEALNVLNFNAPPLVLPSKLPILTHVVPLPAFALASSISSLATSTSSTEMSTFTTSSIRSSYSGSSALLPNAG
ncbi:LOW QUALITY PROTEIN: hypothetical protein BT93_C1231 [Corymbia citriodora subsp. variegata]|nr:LOW QUALITY PROTEIN: hypothetical protein BT93_C1231 [Corymbia citriodora subsp. variegata]